MFLQFEYSKAPHLRTTFSHRSLKCFLYLWYFSCFRLKFLKFLISFHGNIRQIHYSKMRLSTGIYQPYSAIFNVINDLIVKDMKILLWNCIHENLANFKDFSLF